MLKPKKPGKFKKLHRGPQLKTKAVFMATLVQFGDYGLQALHSGWLTSRQIESTRRSITRYVRKTGKIWIRVFPTKPFTKRAAESRMGSGKGSFNHWAAVIKPKSVILELNGLKEASAF